MSFGNRLKWIVEHKGFKVAELAENLNITKKNIYNYFYGTHVPSGSFFFKLCELYPEINMEWLLSGRGDPMKGENEVSMVQDSGIPYNQNFPSEIGEYFEQLEKTINDLQKRVDDLENAK